MQLVGHAMKNSAITTEEVKKLAMVAGADLCGVAPVERFEGAPKGFKPTDIYPTARSVLVAKRLREAVMKTPNPVPYTFATDTVLQEVFRITCELSVALQAAGVTAVPIPSEPYLYWDEEEVSAVLCDHGRENSPTEFTICRHGENTGTLRSVIFYPRRRTVKVLYGHPCENEYQEIGFS